MRFQPSLMLLLLLVSLNLLHESAGLGHHHRPSHRSLLNTAGRLIGSWRHGERWCRASGRGGLAKLGGSGEDEEAARLASRASSLPAGSCYWIAAASVDDLLWLADNSGRRDTGCLCVLTGHGGPKNLRLHVSSCRRRLPYLCQLPRPASAPAARSAGSTTPATRPGVGSTTVEYLTDDAGDLDDSGMDETVDHAKFPMFPDPLPSKASVDPDGHPVGWLPPWPASPTTQPPTSRTTAAPDAVGDNSTRSSAVDNGQLRLLMGSQRSEFVTLLVLYTIVGVICCVLLALCVVRCCRGYCGRAKIRYVKQVDADDIPRFMPSSWA